MTAWCKAHYDRVREEELNAILATTLLARAITSDDAVQRLAGRTDSTKPDARSIAIIAQATRYACCYLGDARLEAEVLSVTRREGMRFPSMRNEPGEASRRDQDMLVREQSTDAQQAIKRLGIAEGVAGKVVS